MKVLVAEDDAISALVLRKALEKLGHDVWVEPNGEQAWEILHGQPFQLVLSDWMMPKLTGIELCKRIRSQYHKSYVYIILLTVKSDEEDRQAAFEAGVDDFLLKPIDPTELVSRLEIAQRVLSMKDQINHATRPESIHELGQVLLEQGIITENQLMSAMNEQIESRQRLGDILCHHGWASEDDIAKARALQTGIPYIDLNHVTPDPSLAALIPLEIAQRYRMIPLSIDHNDKLHVAIENPWDIEGIDLLQRLTKRDIITSLAAPYAIGRQLITFYPIENSLVDTSNDIAPDSNMSVKNYHTAAVSDSLKEVLKGAFLRNASSVHIEYSKGRCDIYYRIDGALQRCLTKNLDYAAVKELAGILNAPARVLNSPTSVLNAPARVLNSPTSVLNANARVQGPTSVLNGDEAGILHYIHDRREYNLPVSMLKHVNGERIVIDGFRQHHLPMQMNELGLLPQDYKNLAKSLSVRQGMYILAGPSDSGKTTTAYALLTELKAQNPGYNIITSETKLLSDLPGVIQTICDEPLSAGEIKATLKQDPDILFVDRIVDGKSLEVLLQASHNGIKIFCSLNAEDTASAIAALLETGVSAYMLSTAITGILVQREIRTLCPECKQAENVTPSEACLLNILGYESPTLYRVRGCGKCNDGYSGKTAVFELTMVDTAARRKIIESSSYGHHFSAMTTMYSDKLLRNAIARVVAGDITMDDVMMSFSREIETALAETNHIRHNWAA